MYCRHSWIFNHLCWAIYHTRQRWTICSNKTGTFLVNGTCYVIGERRQLKVQKVTKIYWPTIMYWCLVQDQKTAIMCFCVYC